MPFGIFVAPGLFQAFMERLLFGIEVVAGLLDDIAIKGKNKEEHMRIVQKVLQRLENFGLQVLNDKSCWFSNRVKYWDARQ